MDIAGVGGGLDAEYRADLFGVLLQGRPRLEGSFCQGVLFYEDAVFNGHLLAAIRDEYDGGVVDEVLRQLSGGGENDGGGAVGAPAGVILQVDGIDDATIREPEVGG